MQVTRSAVLPRVGATKAIALAAVSALILLAFATAPSAQAATANSAAACPSFRVLHNDRIGDAILPKGNYTIKVAAASGLSCKAASKRFSQFLQDWDGVLPEPWAVVPRRRGKALFTRNGEPAFTVVRGIKKGTKPRPSPLGTSCSGFFEVLNNDKIGPLSFKRGNYKLVIPRGSIITCQQASTLFASFLQFPKGNLPKGWSMKSATALFFKPANPKRKRFRVDPGVAGGQTPEKPKPKK